jgi:FkbM family methyltransferase
VVDADARPECLNVNNWWPLCLFLRTARPTANRMAVYVYYAVRAALKRPYFFLFPTAWQARVTKDDQWDELEFSLLPALVDPVRAAVDVGANIGKYALAMSSLVPSVYAVEPSELAQNIARYFPANVKVYMVAASDHAGIASLQIPILDDHEQVGLASIEPGAVAVNHRAYRSVAISTSRLDDLVQDAVGFVKIDVEGHELSVLKGSERLLREHCPTLLIEAEERHRHGAVADVNARAIAFEDL